VCRVGESILSRPVGVATLCCSPPALLENPFARACTHLARKHRLDGLREQRRHLPAQRRACALRCAALPPRHRMGRHRAPPAECVRARRRRCTRRRHPQRSGLGAGPRRVKAQGGSPREEGELGEPSALTHDAAGDIPAVVPHRLYRCRSAQLGRTASPPSAWPRGERVRAREVGCQTQGFQGFPGGWERVESVLGTHAWCPVSTTSTAHRKVRAPHPQAPLPWSKERLVVGSDRSPQSPTAFSIHCSSTHRGLPSGPCATSHPPRAIGWENAPRPRPQGHTRTTQHPRAEPRRLAARPRGCDGAPGGERAPAGGHRHRARPPRQGQRAACARPRCMGHGRPHQQEVRESLC
jgi:hypothetical protein